MASRTRFLRLILEELDSAMTRDCARELLRSALGSERPFEIDALLEAVHGTLRVGLIDQLGRTNGDLLADRICDVLSRHASTRSAEHTSPAEAAAR